MDDDIVTRLREPGLWGWNAQQEAADEIERLREKIQDLRMYAEQDACEIERLREQLAQRTNECQMADDAIQTLQTKLIAAYDDIGRNHAIIDCWRKIANHLVSGAEEQIDELRGTQPPTNPAWLSAWKLYDEAVYGE